jgi:hypothetical protein
MAPVFISAGEQPFPEWLVGTLFYANAKAANATSR